MDENNVEIFYLSIPELIDRSDALSSSSSTINEEENES
jgi:hypothetical protein